MGSLAGIITLGLSIAGTVAADYWDWQLTEPYDLNVNVKLLVMEADDHAAEDIAALKARGVTPICYLSVGTWEDFRDDADQFPEHILGKPLSNWPGERYLDVRQRDVLLPIMAVRIARCAEKGFEGIEPDNMDLYENDNGFGITKADALAYLHPLAAYAKRLGLEVIQKNASELVPDLVQSFDRVLVEECFQYGYCEEFLPYKEAGKDVLVVEFAESGQDWETICAEAKRLGFHLLLKEKEVVAGGARCR